MKEDILNKKKEMMKNNKGSNDFKVEIVGMPSGMMDGSSVD